MRYADEKAGSMMFRQAAFGIAFDLVIAFALVKIFGSEDNLLAETFFVFLAIAVLQIAITLKGWLAKAAWAYFFGRKFVEQAVFEALKEAKFPAPLDYHQRGFGYLAELADDEEAEPSHRVQATLLYVGMTTAWSREGVLRSAAYQVAADDAVQRWIKQLPRKSV